MPKLMAVVKANGYGHGTANAALALRAGGAEWFGVTSLAEAQDLIASGVDSRETPILVFTPAVNIDQAEFSVKAGLHLTVCDTGHFEVIRQAALIVGVTAKVHLKVDTGMGRLGLMPADALKVAQTVSAAKNLELTGIYTHFSSAAASSPSSTKSQFKTFIDFDQSLKKTGIAGYLRHCANSAAMLRLPETRLDLVRCGTLLYGQYPAGSLPKVPGLRPNTLALKARTVFVHELPSGATVGYGSEFTTKRPTRAAVIPVGFADGITMQPASLTTGLRGLTTAIRSVLKPQDLAVSFGLFRAPVIGRVAMQMVVVDVTDAPTPIVVGDIATIPARRLAISDRLVRVASEIEETKSC